MEDNISEKSTKRRSFLEFLPSVDEKPMTRKSFLEDEKSPKQDTPKRVSALDSAQKADVETPRKSFITDMPVTEKVTDKPKRSSALDNMPVTSSRPKQQPQAFVPEGPRDSIFQGQEAPDVKRAMDKIKVEFPEFHKEHYRRLLNMVEKLVPPTILTVSTWGDKAIIDQRELVESTTLIINEFSSANGDELLKDVIASAGYQSEKSFFSKLKNTFNEKKIDYVAQVEGLKIHLSGLLPKMDEQFEKSKDSLLPLWMVAISGVAQTYQTDDAALAEYLDNRRQLLHHAFMNVNKSRSQLEQVRILAVKMYSQIDHVMNVTIPAMMRNQK